LFREFELKKYVLKKKNIKLHALQFLVKMVALA
jgi:hypothetical protein